MNLVILQGTLSSDPVVRELSSGSSLVSLEVSTTTPGGTTSVPVAWFDPPRASVPDWLRDGAEVVVTGVVRRRFFRSAERTQSRTEVVASEIVDARRPRRVRASVARALIVLSD